MKSNLFKLYEFATKMVFEQEPKYMGTTKTITDAQIKEAEEKYDD